MIRVKAPATSANMGPGFDTMGIALNLYNVYHFLPEEKGDSLMSKAFQKVLEYKNKPEISPRCIVATGDIHSSRGLGSSAACIVAGILAADAYLGFPLSMTEKLALATEMEGHPDNVAPALLGGMVTSFTEGKRLYTQKWTVSDRLSFIPLIPPFSLSTKEAREILPQEIRREDALYNIKRIPLLLKALEEGDCRKLSTAFEDRLHQPYRKNLITGFETVTQSLKNKGIPFYVSGAGPTIMAVGTEPEKISKTIEEILPDKWIYRVLQPDTEGAIVL